MLAMRFLALVNYLALPFFLHDSRHDLEATKMPLDLVEHPFVDFARQLDRFDVHSLALYSSA